MTKINLTAMAAALMAVAALSNQASANPNCHPGNRASAPRVVAKAPVSTPAPRVAQVSRPAPVVAPLKVAAAPAVVPPKPEAPVVKQAGVEKPATSEQQVSEQSVPNVAALLGALAAQQANANRGRPAASE